MGEESLILRALRSLFSDVDWQDSPTGAVIADAVDGTSWVQEDTRRIGRAVDGLPCKVLRDSSLDALVASVRMREPWHYVFRAESTPFATESGAGYGLPAGYRFEAPAAFLKGLAADPTVRMLLDALREDRVAVEMHQGLIVLRQQRVDADEAPLLGDAAIGLASALREAWECLIEAPLERQGLRWNGQVWQGQTDLGQVTVTPGRRLAIRVRLPLGLQPGTRLRARRAGDRPSFLPGLLGHHLALSGGPLPESFEDERVGEALLALLAHDASRLEPGMLTAHFRPWPVGESLSECFDQIAVLHWACSSH